MAATWGQTWKMGKSEEQKTQGMNDYFMHIYSTCQKDLIQKAAQ